MENESEEISMKKIISMTLVCMLLIGCVLTLASCGKTLSGKYSAGSGVFGTTYDFKGKNVTITFYLLGTETTSEGTYEITTDENDKEIITFTFENEDAEDYNGEFSFTEGTEGGVDYIKIGGVKYEKADK